MAESPAVAAIRQTDLDYKIIEYGRVNSVEEAAAARGVPIDQVIKSIVVRSKDGEFMMVLVPGDRVIDWSKLRRLVGVSRMSLARADEAVAVTGYRPGTITPFGSTSQLPVIADASMEGPISIGGGAAGLAINLDAADLASHFNAEIADITKHG